MILIDGYNLLFHPRYADPGPDEPLEVRRGRLLSRLARVAARSGERTSILFDGDASVPDATRRVLFAGLEVRFSPEGTSADDEIVAYLGRRARPEDVTVVTDDRALRLRVLAAGGHARFAGPLAESISTVPPPPRARRGDASGGPERQPPPGSASVDWIDYFGFGEDELEVSLDTPDVALPPRLEAHLRRTPDEDDIQLEIPTDQDEIEMSDAAVQAWLRYFGLK